MENKKELDRATIQVLKGEKEAECVKVHFHIKQCEKCRKIIIENGEPLNR